MTYLIIILAGLVSIFFAGYLGVKIETVKTENEQRKWRKWEELSKRK